MTKKYRLITMGIWLIMLCLQLILMIVTIIKTPDFRWSLTTSQDLAYPMFTSVGFMSFLYDLLYWSIAFLIVAWVMRLVFIYFYKEPSVLTRFKKFGQHLGLFIASIAGCLLLSRFFSAPFSLYYQYIFQELISYGNPGLIFLILFAFLGGLLAGPAFKTIWFLWVAWLFRDPTVIFFCVAPSIIGDLLELCIFRAKADF